MEPSLLLVFVGFVPATGSHEGGMRVVHEDRR